MLEEDPGLRHILSFCVDTIEHRVHKDPKTKREEHFYSWKPELFEIACKMHLLPQEVWLEARGWCRVVEKAANDAAKGVGTQPTGERRPGELRKVEKPKKPRRKFG